MPVAEIGYDLVLCAFVSAVVVFTEYGRHWESLCKPGVCRGPALVKCGEIYKGGQMMMQILGLANIPLSVGCLIATAAVLR